MPSRTAEEIKQEQIQKLHDKAMGKTFPETIAVDISNINTKNKVGGQMSSRQRISVQLEDGSVVDGFYTEDNYTDYYKQFDDYMQQVTSEYDANPQKSELGAEFLNRIKDKFNPYSIYAAMVNSTNEYKIKDIYNTDLFKSGNITTRLFLSHLKSMDQTEGIEYDQYYTLFDDSNFKNIFKEIGEKSVALGSGIAGNIDKGQLSGNKRNVNRRNNALYEVSALLGHKDLVCQSVNMTTTKGGQQTYGSFMVNAKGTDIENVNRFVTKTGQTVPMEYSGKAKKDMSRLQVLDFICGNADRHSGNFFYDIEYINPDRNNTTGKLVIKGLQGIDNDMSFGKLQGQGDPVTGYMSNVDDIKVIDKDQKDAILNPDFAKGFENQMRLLNLSQDEIAAGLGRLSILKEKLTHGNEIEVIDNEERWNNLDTRQLETSLTENDLNIWSVGQDIIKKSRLGTKTTIDDFLYPMSENPPQLSQAKNESSKLLFESQLRDLKTLKEEFDKTNPEKGTREFRKMYGSLNTLIQNVEKIKDKESLSDIEYNKLSMGFKKVMDNTEEYIRKKPKNPRSQNGKDRLHCAKNMLSQATKGRHLVLEENTAAFNRRMAAEYNKFNRDYKDLVSIDKALSNKENHLTQDYYVNTIRTINAMSKTNPNDTKLQVAAGYIQEKLMKGLGEEACKSKLSQDDLEACSETMARSIKANESLKLKPKQTEEKAVENNGPEAVI